MKNLSNILRACKCEIYISQFISSANKKILAKLQMGVWVKKIRKLPLHQLMRRLDMISSESAI